MTAHSDPKTTFFHLISLEAVVRRGHDSRRARLRGDAKTIRKACGSPHAPTGRPSIPPEMLFPELVGGESR